MAVMVVAVLTNGGGSGDGGSSRLYKEGDDGG